MKYRLILMLDRINIARMRDKLIHDYFNTDVKIIWQAVLEDVPQLKMAIARVLEDLRNS